jgi:Met-zincin/Domain of unknown function (DUF5117)
MRARTTPVRPSRAATAVGWLLFSCVIVLAASVRVEAQLPTIATRTAGLQRAGGFIPFYWDETRGRLLLELSVFGRDVLYFVSTAASPGSVELGMDRGVDEQKVVHFQRIGARVLVVGQNLRYRALGGPEALKRNVADSFATSVLASLPVEAEEGGRALVDATSLIVRDANGVESGLRRREQGTFRLDATRSSIYPPRTKAFPKNTEVEALLTFAGDSPGSLVQNVTPEPTALTMRVHHSFVEAPTGYTPRVADPRIGNTTLRFSDLSAPFSDTTEVRWIRRWRLQKKDPSAAMSEPTQPIVFFVDPAIPEPIRSAMKTGVERWSKAFEPAGFRNAVRAADPTPDMDPMDIRYSWLLWINRDERGFSSGGGYSDPRTGEILGAKVRMDSARIRTIGNYFETYIPGDDNCALVLPPFEDLLSAFQRAGAAAMPAGAQTVQDLVLVRQALLTLHETGHSLGFQHNWNSSMNGRASVMEYPTPRVKVGSGGTLDLTDAYRAEPGPYDVFMVRYAYTDFPAGYEKAGLDAIVKEMRAAGMLFTASSDPRWNWYDDLESPDLYLRETMAARKVMLEHYGPALLEAGALMSDLRDMRLWMAYLHHRWAVEAGMKYIGGQYQNIVVKGDSLKPVEPVPAALQKSVLSLLLEAIRPENLALPDHVLDALPAAPDGRDLEDIANDYVFDHLRAARILAASVLEPLFAPDRAARLIALADRQADALSLSEVIRSVASVTWDAPRDSDHRARSLRRVTQRVALDSLMALGANAQVTPEVRALVMEELVRLATILPQRHDEDAVTEAHLRQAERDIARYLENPSAVAPRSVMPPWGARPRSRYPLPPGPPL